MAGTARSAGQHRVRRFARALAADPVEALLYVPEELTGRLEYPVDYRVDESWEPELHRLLGAPWPCPQTTRASELWAGIADELRQRGLDFGRHTYGAYSDADECLARAVWCTVLHRRPEVVVETGVARGVITRVILEGLAENDRGHLWSIDLPHPFERGLHDQTGVAVPGPVRSRWTYVEGSSRRRLPRLARELGTVDMFVHDSLHTARNTRFEMDRIARVLAPGGVMLVDDISTHQGFEPWTRAPGGAEALVCRSADREGLFGIVRTGSGTGSGTGGGPGPRR
ncbi:class I SAM-dependent methyltransferase [Streptacidiphilus sp. PB12-B1b]|uniref:class I SAM-dependent methyltransferase n=1 Tax=Streptacidiphilus sp. PB12-B1b TaxID=2705012 RepID=UPI0015FC218F|nr:class I SAM-dependent methyltransferase [Streptacidiphilus sp. PB12-B1b]QMU77014.1 class I SAM-dependent methyltransferase [Streptacidiphilus sp. PB12-B1b]